MLQSLSVLDVSTHPCFSIVLFVFFKIFASLQHHCDRNENVTCDNLESIRCWIVAPLAAVLSRPVLSSRSLVRSVRERVLFFRPAAVIRRRSSRCHDRLLPDLVIPVPPLLVISVVVYFCVTYSTCTVRCVRDIRLSRIIKCSIVCPINCVSYIIVKYSILQRWQNTIPLQLQATYSTREDWKSLFPCTKNTIRTCNLQSTLNIPSQTPGHASTSVLSVVPYKYSCCFV